MNTPLQLAGVKRILLIRIGKIGDLIVFNFVLRKIRAEFPHATIMLVTLPRNRELLRYNRSVDHVRFFRKGLDVLPLLFQIRAFHPDLFLDFNDNASSTSSLLARFSPARVRVGFSFAGSSRHLTHAVACPAKEETHITERLRRIPEAIGITFAPEEVAPSMDLGTTEVDEVRLQLEAKRKDTSCIIAVNLSAGDPNRYWQEEKWCQLLRQIAERTPDAGFALLTAPGEEDLALRVSRSLPSLNTFVPMQRSLHHFAAFIALSDLLISPDTSAIHIASAFRIPILSLYPAVEWNYRSWRPLSSEAEVVRPMKGLVPDITVVDMLEAYVRLQNRLPSLQCA
jgi:ADP-heptose:LPS heptosyltransferase